MKTSPSHLKSGVILFWLLSLAPAEAQQLNLVAAATNFLNSLDDQQKALTQFEFTDVERFDWHYIPKSRLGITFHELTPGQRDAALELLRVSVSGQGFAKATAIMQLDSVLKALEGRPADDHFRDPLNYHFSVFGTPSNTDPWGWRLEGHHLSLNFCSLDGQIGSATPTFYGSNPATIPRGPERGKMILKQESDLGFTLVNSLTANQRKEAMIADSAPPDMITKNDRSVGMLSPRGIPYSHLTDDQKRTFMNLLNVYLGNYEFGFADRFLEKIKKAGIDSLSFGWAGSLQPGAGHYYRIESPVLLIEFDNTQNDANHIHTVVRDLTNDWGGDILREHYALEHGK